MIGARYRDTIIVNTKDGETVKGIFWGSRGGALRLRQAHLLQDGKQPVPVDGEVVVFKENVSFCQRLMRAE